LESDNPLANVASPPRPSGAAQGNPQQANPLASLAGPLPMPAMPPRMPAPTAAQTQAGLRRFDAVMSAMRAIMRDPDLGRTNLRPKIMDQASKLIGSKVISLAQCMQAIAPLNDQPLDQKNLVSGIYNAALQASNALLDHHGAAVATGRVPREGGEKYDLANHERHMSDLLNSHYPMRS
jgi:hypothetical protein